jgi:hypothetical protein
MRKTWFLFVGILLMGCDSKPMDRETYEKIFQEKWNALPIEMQTIHEETGRRVAKITHAIRAYIKKHGRPPEQLGELITPLDGQGFLENAEALEDYWKSLFQFQINKTDDPLDQVEVWTVSPYGFRVWALKGMFTITLGDQ